MKLIISTLFFLMLASCAHVNDFYEKVKTKEVVEVNPYDQFRVDTNIHPISDQLADLEYLKKFREITCKYIKDEEACASKYKEMRDARFKLKYKYANFENMKEFCVGYPVECESNIFLEALYANSNNYNVNSTEEEEISKRKKQEQEDTERAVVSFFSGMAAANQRAQEQNFVREQVRELKTSNCTTNVWGNQISSSCR